MISIVGKNIKISLTVIKSSSKTIPKSLMLAISGKFITGVMLPRAENSKK